LRPFKGADAIIKHTGRKAVVIGAGAIGIELAITLRHLGYRVIIIEMLDRRSL
jgi:NADPH-dependent 2,4-dienoyl-CoA reductase/sulfur reductase-like enzyme